MKTKLLHYLKVWIPLAVVVSLMSGMVYFAVQQNYRQNANDPQIQIVEDITGALSGGANPAQLNQNNKVDISKSLSTFIIIFDDKGAPIASTGVLNNETPKLPSGVFDYVRSHGEDRITWQPEAGVRAAIVVKSFTASTGSGFVVVGRSLREVEKRTTVLCWQVLIGWVASLIVLMITLAANDFLFMWLHRPAPQVQHSEPEKPVDL